MGPRLLDRQVSLLVHLTSKAAIFGDEGDASLDQALQGIDPGLLRLEACFSHEKRMEKIAVVFPRTFALLGSDRAAIVREFTAACPPVDISRIENARQFYEFFCARLRHEPIEPPYLRDVAACELACARARVGAKYRDLVPETGKPAPSEGIRRHPGVILLRCGYDIRPVFEAGSGEAVPAKRDTLLAIAIPPDAEHPRVFEVAPPVFNVLAALDDWTAPSTLDATPELEELICELAAHGLVEVRR